MQRMYRQRHIISKIMLPTSHPILLHAKKSPRHLPNESSRVVDTWKRDPLVDLRASALPMYAPGYTYRVEMSIHLTQGEPCQFRRGRFCLLPSTSGSSRSRRSSSLFSMDDPAVLGPGASAAWSSGLLSASLALAAPCWSPSPPFLRVFPSLRSSLLATTLSLLCVFF